MFKSGYQYDIGGVNSINNIKLIPAADALVTTHTTVRKHSTVSQ